MQSETETCLKHQETTSQGLLRSQRFSSHVKPNVTPNHHTSHCQINLPPSWSQHTPRLSKAFLCLVLITVVYFIPYSSMHNGCEYAHANSHRLPSILQHNVSSMGIHEMRSLSVMHLHRVRGWSCQLPRATVRYVPGSAG